MHLLKSNQDEEFWPRLLKDKNLEKNTVSIDWNKYVDEDEAEGGFDLGDLNGGMDFGGMGGMGGMDFSKLAAMGGMGGMGMPEEDDGADSDDGEELPDLEPNSA